MAKAKQPKVCGTHIEIFFRLQKFVFFVSGSRRKTYELLELLWLFLLVFV